jgi:hypothetical protein
MSDRDRTGPVYIAGAAGRILRVGDRDLGDDTPVQNRAAGSLYEQYESTADFAAAVAAAERQLEEDKRKLKQMTVWRRYAKRRAEREVQLFARLHGDQAFPAPMDRRRP